MIMECQSVSIHCDRDEESRYDGNGIYWNAGGPGGPKQKGDKHEVFGIASSGGAAVKILAVGVQSQALIFILTC